VVVVFRARVKRPHHDLGRERKLLIRPLAGGTPKVLLASLKDLTVRWSGDGLRYAYFKEGALYAGAVADSAPKEHAGPPPAKPDSLQQVPGGVGTGRNSSRFGDGPQLPTSCNIWPISSISCVAAETLR
jgi:hypothetical protein